ncbi:MAG: relaxase/mobilization nuclease domain-containing protein [Ruminococcus flavefaciens]|nr:relaxase/mobilization nuclease domain-containing protein [Ruminococcus flavefaciens]MDD7515300.1 relaxase/mobilization nuclease domain-containing protein [Ruminococcus flavefaciens]
MVTQGCSSIPEQAHRDYEEIRANGTGRSSVLAQHFIVSFKPGEITPERALQYGQEICEQFLKGEYQYFMACHIDKGHVHLHCVFNNTNCIDGRTFETHENRRTTKEDRSFKKLMNITDSVCKKYHLFVIKNPERTKGKSHWEWDMNRQGLSWKAKLKYAIDQVVKVSEDFNDFLTKCAEYGILVEYNPDHKIDLKFMLAEQKENNPRAKFTRAKTLGWYYETEQITGRIAQYHGTMIYAPKTKIKIITPKVEENKFVRDAIDRGNIKATSKAINILTQYGVEQDQVYGAAMAAYAHRTHLVSELNNLNTQIEDLQVKLNVLQKYRKLKVYAEELKKLKGSAAKKYRKNNTDELAEYGEIRKQVLELYPSGTIRKLKILKSKLQLCGKSCHRQMQSTVRQTRKPVSLPTHSGRSRNISVRSRAEISNRSVSGMILNDDRLSDERKSHSEPFMMIMGETCLLDKQSPQKSEGFVCDLGESIPNSV